MLTRNALLVDMEKIRRATDIYAPTEAWRHHGKNAPLICVNAARAVIRLLADVDPYMQKSLLAHQTPLLVAISVLAISIVKHPSARLSQSDFHVYLATLPQLTQIS